MSRPDCRCDRHVWPFSASRVSLGRSPANDYLINQSVFNRLLGTEVQVALSILLDLAQALTGVPYKDVVDLLAHAQNLTRLDIDVGRLALGAPQGLMNHNPRMRQAVASSL